MSASWVLNSTTGHPAMIGDFDSPRLWLYLWPAACQSSERGSPICEDTRDPKPSSRQIYMLASSCQCRSWSSQVPKHTCLKTSFKNDQYKTHYELVPLSTNDESMSILCGRIGISVDENISLDHSRVQSWADQVIHNLLRLDLSTQIISFPH